MTLMEAMYIFQALATAAGAAMMGGLFGWCTSGLALTVRPLLSRA
jgi:hypothetical protein